MGHPLFLSGAHEDSPGVNVVFNACRALSAVDTVPLGRIVLLGAPTPRDVTLRVVGFVVGPQDPHCPFVTKCDAPSFSMSCVEGGEQGLGRFARGAAHMLALLWFGASAHQRGLSGNGSDGSRGGS
jgi:hypothetical protein